MKYVKMLGLLAVAAAALMAFAGTASATELTAPTGTKLQAGAVIKATAEGTTKLDGSVTIECKGSHVEGEITNAGGSGATVSGPVTTLSFTECGGDTVTVATGGTLTTHSLGNGNATLTSSGAEVTVLTHTAIFNITIHCIYVTNNTHIGTLTGSHNTTTTATLDIGSAPILQTPTGGACGEDAVWTGNYEVTSPDHLYVD